MKNLIIVSQLYLRLSLLASTLDTSWGFTITTHHHHLHNNVLLPSTVTRSNDVNNDEHIKSMSGINRSMSRTKMHMSTNGGAAAGAAAGAELTSALATLDREWQQKRNRSSQRPTGGKGWTKLILEPRAQEAAAGSYTSSPGSNGDGSIMESFPPLGEEEFVYLLEPPGTPSIIISFLGGAGLGQFPHIAYSELLSRISNRLNAAIIAAPYPLSLDHFDLSKKSGEALRRAIVQCEEKGGYSANLPKFYLGHSLGSKLLAIALAASGVRDVEGICFMSYNNFGFKDTISMVKDFADDLNENGNMGGSSSGGGGTGSGVGAFDQILDFAGEAVGMLGFEFSPDPVTMDRIIEMKFDDALQKKTRLLIFDDDDLDSSEGFIQACDGEGPSISRLEGRHLSPVFVKLGIDELDIADEVKPFVDEASGGFQSASFGDENAMNGAVDEICDWIMGKEPSKRGLLTAQE